MLNDNSYVRKYDISIFRTGKAPRDTIGTCQLTGMFGNRSEMVRQLDYVGTGLLWQGFWVLKRFANKPNPQGLIPPYKPSPIPIKYPLPDPRIVYGFFDNNNS